ncbi:MAG: hypothetical protein IJM20_00625 [Clostridia bacterium]|nr:hypothetical protein [Clostridia bacterium]
MKRFIAIILTALLLLPLAACAGGQEPAPTAGPNTTASPDETSGPGGEDYVPDFGYNPDTDFDRRLGMNGNRSTVFETEDVYYWLLDNDGYLRYSEKDGSDGGVVCARPECVHDNGNAIAYHREKNCNGYVGSVTPYMWMLDGKIYFINDYEYITDREGTCGTIVRMDPDGTNKEVVKSIPKPKTPYGDGLNPQNYCYHRGMLYSFVFGGSIEQGEPSQPFVAMAFPLDGDEWQIIYDSGRDFHYGSIMPVGDYCYITDQAWSYADPSILEDDNYDGEVITGRNEDILLRWNSVTGELEELYRGNELGWIFLYWIDEEGNFYTISKYEEGVGSNRVLRLTDGEWEEVLNFDDPDMNYTIRSLSDGIVIARNYKEYNRDGMDPDIDIWIKRYDGTTVYKGKLPMAWLDTMETTKTLERSSLVCGDENELLCIFETTKRTPDRSNEPRTYVFVKYAITEDGLEEILLGTTYHEIVNDW